MRHCSICEEKVAIRPAESTGPLRTWPSYANLISSAERGCTICILVRQHLTTHLCEELLHTKDGEVRMYGRKDSFSVECAAFHGGFEIRTCKTIQETRIAPSHDKINIIPQARAWLDECIRRHEACVDPLANQLPTTAMLPRRLLDLSQGCNIIVADVAEWASLDLCSIAELSEYCTLSYQWGSASHSCVLSDSFSILLEIKFETMPQTFKDAIVVARALGVRFLWIDALCIVQPAASGDDKDWRIEGPRMGVIYEHSMFTIAATCASSADDGFLGKVGNSVYCAEPCRVLSRDRGDDDNEALKDIFLDICEPSFFQAVSSSSLNARGWVMQERALSRRLIHFTDHGMFWECSQAKLHEHFGSHDATLWRVPCRTKETLLSVARARSSEHLCPVEWFHFIGQYSRCGFTDPQDRLIALSSVVRAAQPMLGGHSYYAGIWSHELVRGLMWSCQSPSTRLRSRSSSLAPTWSWASVEGTISFACLGLETFSTELVEVMSMQATHAVPDNPFGNLTSGRLTLKGRPTKISLPTTNSWYREMERRLLVCWDEPQDTTQSYRGYVVLPIGACNGSGFSSNSIMFGALILGLAERPKDERVYLNTDCAFRRIGWLEYIYHDPEAQYQIRSYEWLRDGKQKWWEEYATTVSIV